MQEIPECLTRRYKALDDLVKELNAFGLSNVEQSSDDPSIRLLCDFWNILQENPEVNLSQEVQQRMNVDPKKCSSVWPQKVSCYMSGCCKKFVDKKVNESETAIKQEPSKPKVIPHKLCSTPSGENDTAKLICDVPKSSKTKNTTISGDELPLNKVLCNLKEAATFELKCQAKVNKLLENQKQLQEQIQILERKEEEGIQLMKQADCMWSCMEDTYKKKIADSLDRQKDLIERLKEVEKSNKKWRQNKKDLESQMENIDKCHQEILDQINQKESDINCLDIEMDSFIKRIESNNKDIETTKKSFAFKKEVSDAKILNISKDISKLEKILSEEQKCKTIKEQEGANYVKESRDGHQKICKALLQKRLENEDMKAEKEALLLEIELLKRTCDQCKEKCKNKNESIIEEIKSIDKEIADFKVRCIRCHECTDTLDVRKFCTDCPRCAKERDCLLEGENCSYDPTEDCVCTVVKQKFLDNVFDNMYTMLERQVKSGPGKAVAEAVMNCLKKSRNGKLNAETRKILQDFILTTVKKNLRFTIIGGAVKTRCEMDADTYKQLMLCLNEVTVKKPEKTEKGTEKKAPCKRWGGTGECNCPKGKKDTDCVCSKKAPSPPNEPQSCPSKEEEKEDKGETVACPYKESAACGPDCAMHELPSSVGSDVASWKPNPCQAPTCQFKNMRAAQCVLGPEALCSYSNAKILEKPSLCKCGHSSTASCVCHDDLRSYSRGRIIEEVMGRYTDVTAIEKLITDTKQLKAGKTKTCDNEICKTALDQQVLDLINQSEHITKDSLNLVLQSDKKNLNDLNPIISKTLSGHLKIALNENFVAEIKKNIESGTNVYVILRKTDLGKLVFSLHSDITIKDVGKIFSPKKSPSGNIFLEPYMPTNEKSFKNVTIIEPQKDTNVSLEVTYKQVDKKSDSNTKLNVNTDKLKDINIKESQNEIYKTELKQNKSVNVNIEATSKQDDKKGDPNIKYNVNTDKFKNVNSKELQSEIYKTDLKQNKSVNVNISKQYDKKNDPNTKLNVNIDENNNNGLCDKKYNHDKKCELYKVKIKGIESKLKESLFAIKQINSGNYEVVLDQEFKKIYKQAIKDYKGNDSLQYVNLITTNSGNFLLNLGENHDDNAKMNKVLIVKSESGNIKVLTDTTKSEVRDSIQSKSILTSTAFKELLNKMANSIKECCKDNIKKPRLASTKSNSDSNLYEKERLNFHTKLKILDESSEFKNSVCKAIATSCNGQNKDSTCDFCKCTCKNVCYKSNQWFWENSSSEKCSRKRCEIYNEKNKDKLPENKRYNSIYDDDNFIRMTPHSTIDSGGCHCLKEKYCNDHYYYPMEDDACSYHMGTDGNILCDKCNSLMAHMEDNPTIFQWNSLNYLPPQLPPFLKNFTYS